MNKVILIGRLVKEPELRQTNSGDAVLINAIAVNRDYTNQQGEREADFINFVAYRNTAELINKYVRKGHRLALEGRWQRRSYVNNNNQTVYVDELIVEKMDFIQDKQEEKPAYNDDPYAGQYRNNQYQNNSYQNQRNNGNYQANNQPNKQAQPKPDPFANVQNQYSVSDDDLPF